jgi:hypothetical protein
MGSAAQAELDTLFLNCKQATIFCFMLEEMGHPQHLILINCNNSTAVGIANNTVKCKCSWSMEMRFFWVADALEQGKFDIKNFPGKENPADYQRKHQMGAHHLAVYHWYLHRPMSVHEHPQACILHSEKVCWNPPRWIPTYEPATSSSYHTECPNYWDMLASLLQNTNTDSYIT